MTSFLSNKEKDIIERVKSRKKMDKEKKELSKAKEYLKSKTTFGRIKSKTDKIDKNLERTSGKIIKAISSTKKVQSKRVLRKEPVALQMKDYKAENIFDDPNRFFKGEMEAAKKSMFFS